MKSILFIVMLVVSSLVSAADVSKWVDDEGRIHYGDKPETIDPSRVETLKFEESFDQQAYDEAVQRNEQIEKEQQEIDTEREEADEETAKSEDERKARAKAWR